jgi:hypothetical protein
MRWEKFHAEGCDEAFRLKVFFSDCPHGYFYGEDAALFMRSFGLPETPPDLIK